MYLFNYLGAFFGILVGVKVVVLLTFIGLKWKRIFLTHFVWVIFIQEIFSFKRQDSSCKYSKKSPMLKE